MTWKSNRREMPKGLKKNARIEDLFADTLQTAGTAGRGDEQTDWRATVQTDNLDVWTLAVRQPRFYVVQTTWIPRSFWAATPPVDGCRQWTSRRDEAYPYCFREDAERAAARLTDAGVRCTVQEVY